LDSSKRKKKYQEVIPMVKLLSIFGLRPGVDPEETYKHWLGKHGSWVKDKVLPEAKRYITNRVVHKFGETDIYGVAEIWFDDLESAQRAIGRLGSAQPDEFISKLITPPMRILVQEKDIEL